MLAEQKRQEEEEEEWEEWEEYKRFEHYCEEICEFEPRGTFDLSYEYDPLVLDDDRYYELKRDYENEKH